MDERTLGVAVPPNGFRRLSWSVMRTWLNCNRKWYYRYIGGFDSHAGDALIFGTLFHSLLEEEALLNIECEPRWEDEVRRRRDDFESYWNEKQSYLQPIVNQWLDEHRHIIANALASGGSIAPPKYDYKTLDDMADLAMRMMYYWTATHGADDLAKHRFISCEFKFRDTPLLDDFGDEIPGWKANGMVDVFLQCRETGQFIVRDYKTTGASNAADFAEKAGEMDAQTHFYVSNLEAIHGIEISRIQYATMRKKSPAVPKWINSKKGTDPSMIRDGKEPSIRKDIDSTRDVVVGWLESEGLPLSLIDGKTFHPWSRYFYVYDFPAQQHEIDRVRSESQTTASQIENALEKYFRHGDPNRAFPRNTSSCCSIVGYCQYKNVCAKGIKAEDVSMGMFYQSRPEHPEL